VPAPQPTAALPGTPEAGHGRDGCNSGLIFGAGADGGRLGQRGGLHGVRRRCGRTPLGSVFVSAPSRPATLKALTGALLQRPG